MAHRAATANRPDMPNQRATRSTACMRGPRHRHGRCRSPERPQNKQKRRRHVSSVEVGKPWRPALRAARPAAAAVLEMRHQREKYATQARLSLANVASVAKIPNSGFSCTGGCNSRESQAGASQPARAGRRLCAVLRRAVCRGMQCANQTIPNERLPAAPEITDGGQTCPASDACGVAPLHEGFTQAARPVRAAIAGPLANLAKTRRLSTCPDWLCTHWLDPGGGLLAAFHTRVLPWFKHMCTRLLQGAVRSGVDTI